MKYYVHVLALMTIGYLCGVLSYHVVSSTQYPLAGLIFGIGLGVYLFTFEKIKSFLALIFFITASTVGYIIALEGVPVVLKFLIDLLNLDVGLDILEYQFFIAGLLGPAILIFGVHKTIKPFTNAQFFVFVLFGIFLTIGSCMISDNLTTIFPSHSSNSTESGEFDFVYVAIPIWQTVMAAVIGYIAFRNGKLRVNK